MRLAEDDRGRVPFALIGVLLLVGSAALSAGLASRPTDRAEPGTDRAFERATAAMRTALTTAVRTAGRDAASAPITRRAETPYGRALNESTPFRDALRIRIYLAARRGLERIEGRAGSVRVRAALPPIANASALRRAKRRVHVERVGGERDGELSTRVRVRLDGIDVTARRGGRTVERETRSLTVVVATPVLALHDRVSAYEERLNRGPLDGGPGAGLGARLTARLYPVAWARGYAQYGGAPIENVVANRHVAFAANGGVLGVQRAVFGRSDPGGRRAVSRAGRRVAMADLRAGAGLPGSKWSDLLLAPSDDGRAPYPSRSERSGPDVNGTIRVGVNRTADAAFRAFVRGDGRPSLRSVADAVYGADVRLSIRTRTEREEDRPSARPGPSWTRIDASTDVEERVESVAARPPDVPAGERVLDAYGRRVVRRRVATTHWRRGNETRRTVTTWEESYRVDLAVVGEVGPTSYAPSRTVETVYERGGPLDGPNLEGVPRAARARLVDRRGGADALARRAVDGSVGVRRAEIDGRQSPKLETWLYADLAELRRRVRDVSVGVPRGAVGRAKPAARLADALRSRRAKLVDAPERYGSVAGKARVAVRAAYLDRVLSRLDARAGRNRKVRGRLNDALADAGAGSLSRLGRVAHARKRASQPPRRELGTDGPAGDLAIRVDGEPSYLTLSAVSREHTSAVTNGSYRPLAARNVNLFTTPYGDAADAVVAAVAGKEGTARVDLRTAALVLRSANRTLGHVDDAVLDRRRNALRRDLGDSLAGIRGDVRGDLREEPFGLDERERRAVVASGFSRWDTAEARALAASNGSAARAIAAAIERRSALVRRSDRARDWMRVRVRLSVSDAVAGSRVRVPRKSVNRTATRTRQVSRRVATEVLGNRIANATDRARTRWFEETLGAIPSGLPVAPVPGYWYATMNVWHVEVRGSYAAFTVRANRGTPASPGAMMQYTREPGAVSIDVDGDGATERLGRTEAVSFETSTAVIVVVPPNGRGVGDTDGNADERSAGWSTRSGNPFQSRAPRGAYAL